MWRWRFLVKMTRAISVSQSPSLTRPTQTLRVDEVLRITKQAFPVKVSWSGRRDFPNAVFLLGKPRNRLSVGGPEVIKHKNPYRTLDFGCCPVWRFPISHLAS